MVTFMRTHLRSFLFNRSDLSIKKKKDKWILDSHLCVNSLVLSFHSFLKEKNE